MRQCFDVAVVGGGVSGLACALSLARSPLLSRLKIALIEPIAFKPNHISNRQVALSPSSVAFLKQLNIWQNIKRIKHFSKMNVWDSHNKIIFKSNDTIATIVENNLIQESLLDVIHKDATNITIFNPERVEKVSLSNDRQLLQLTSGMEIDCELVIGADGPNSKIRTSANINAFGWNYNQVGLVSTMKISETDNNTAWQRFLPTGPIALLPNSNTHSSLVWTINRELSTKLLNLPQKDFSILVNAAFTNPTQDLTFLLANVAEDGSHSIDFESEVSWGKTRQVNYFDTQHLPVILESGPRSVFPLRLQHVESYTAPGVVLIGYN
jgi:ubiquinone biosynthesis monooxygenase Coq6